MSQPAHKIRIGVLQVTISRNHGEHCGDNRTKFRALFEHPSLGCIIPATRMTAVLGGRRLASPQARLGEDHVPSPP
jgi:hypothetical protein